MERNEGLSAVEEAERIMDRNPLLEISAKSVSVMIIANYVNEYIVPGINSFNFTDEQKRVYQDLAVELDLSLLKYQEQIPEKVTLVISSSEISALDDLRRNISLDRNNLGRFQYSDAVTELEVSYYSAHKKFMGRKSKVFQFIDRIGRIKNG